MTDELETTLRRAAGERPARFTAADIADRVRRRRARRRAGGGLAATLLVIGAVAVVAPRVGEDEGQPVAAGPPSEMALCAALDAPALGSPQAGPVIQMLDRSARLVSSGEVGALGMLAPSYGRSVDLVSVFDDLLAVSPPAQVDALRALRGAAEGGDDGVLQVDPGVAAAIVALVDFHSVECARNGDATDSAAPTGTTSTPVTTSTAPGLTQTECEAFAALLPMGATEPVVVVFMHPDASDVHVEDVASMLEQDGRVTSFDYVDQEAAYDEFLEAFAERPDMLDAIGPTDLPSSFRVILHRDRTWSGPLDEVESHEGVYQVVSGWAHGSAALAPSGEVDDELRRQEEAQAALQRQIAEANARAARASGADRAGQDTSCGLGSAPR